MAEAGVAVVGVADDHQPVLGQHVQRLAPVAEGGVGAFRRMRPGRRRSGLGAVQPPVRAGHRLAGRMLPGPVVRGGGEHEAQPVLRQQAALPPESVALHQQADARQVAGAHVQVGRGDEGAGAIAFPHRRADAQRLEQRGPGIVRVTVAGHSFQRRREQIAVAAGIAHAPAGQRIQREIRGERGHVVAPAGVEHRHHRGGQRRVFVVLFPGETGRPVQHMAQGHAGMPGERRVMLRGRIVEMEPPLAVGDAEHAGQHALAHRPDQVRRVRLRRPGVALVDQAAIADHQQRVGAHAQAAVVVARRKGVGLQRRQRRTGGRRVARPVVSRPVFGDGQAGEDQQHAEQ
ncbi:hypothetical protein D3C76_848630 [compost metagenome]